MKMNPVIHFEMPATDRKRMADFYSKVFGWKTQLLGEEMGNYVLATTTDSDDAGPKKPGAINGGFFPKEGETKDLTTSVVISVDNIADHIKIVKKSGGKILGEIMDIPGIGKFVSIEDTEGNRVGMLQPAPMRK